ncbi:MAG: BREX-1 system adenine-specific DNA-methyltransferase PglX [Lachnospiraceae bacterium]
MDKNAIKKYAVWARRELIARVSQKAAQYEVTEESHENPDAQSVNGRVLSDTERKQRSDLIKKIKESSYEQVIEEVAYTWFNRFIALRFMEVNGYLPSRVRIFTDAENNFKPEILAEAIHLEMEGLEKEKVFAYKEANDTEGLYKYLLITQCNALNEVLPGMFEKIDDYTMLLLPDNLLREGSVIEQMISIIPEEDWMDAIQIIGWLYQYYNSEKKDDVFAALKKNVKITKENIPAATQLFTPDWIVRYMVENSLGRLWVEGHPNDELKSQWKYYLEEAEQEPEVQTQLDSIREEYKTLKPEDILCIDPCCGSGHILAYMFDVLMQIYEAYGYTTREAVASIVKKNIYGLDIDDRAAQLAYFSVMMKACQYDKRFLLRKVQPHVYAIVESGHTDNDGKKHRNYDEYALEYFCNGDANLKAAMDTIISELHDAKEYGSIITVSQQDWAALYARFEEVRENISMSRENVLNDLLSLVQVAEALAQKYDVVVTNPPYMGASNMNQKLNDFIKQNYTDYKSDFFSAFVIHCSEMAKKSGYCGFFTPYVWMFIQSYEKMRNYLYNQATIETLIQFEYSAFEEATVPVCTFAFQNSYVQKKGCYLRLADFRGGMEVQRQKTLEAITNHDCGYYYEQSTDNFFKIPGKPVAYWVSEKFIEAYSAKTIGEYGFARSGLQTGNNDLFLKYWHEVQIECIAFNMKTKGEYLQTRKKWTPQIKGGEYRKWYGNFDYIVNWQNDGAEIRQCDGCRLNAMGNDDLFFKPGITWSHTTSSVFGARYLPGGCLFNVEAPTLFLDDNRQFYFLGFLNSCVAQKYLSTLNSTMHYLVGNIIGLPIYVKDNTKAVDLLVTSNITLSRTDWDYFETSWNFQRHPLVRPIATVDEAFHQWETECNDRFKQLKENEEELNRIFIDIYGLQDELNPEVEDKEVTVRKADLERDIKSFISYAVGCMFGRYSIDEEGLVYAGGEWDDSKYSTFAAEKDNIIPISDDEYFEDDIVARFVKFVEVVYGKDTLQENLKFIADALGGKGQPKDVIRNYFLNDFYKDHCKIYQKRPIYWLFDSGKKNGFKCLIYMHRYQPDTISRIRTDYVHEQQSRYRTAIEELEQRIANASTSERVKLNKQLKKLQNQSTELHEYEEKIHHLADQMISIDLDDGVKVNYEKFKDVLAKIK